MSTVYVAPENQLLRVDGCPLQDDKLSFPLKSWLAVLADTINSTFALIESNIVLSQGATVPQLTAAQIADLTGQPNGWLAYDTTNNVYVGKQSGSLVKFTTTSYP